MGTNPLDYDTKILGGWTYVYLKGEWINHGLGLDGENKARRNIAIHKLFDDKKKAH